VIATQVLVKTPWEELNLMLATGTVKGTKDSMHTLARTSDDLRWTEELGDSIYLGSHPRPQGPRPMGP